jgi:hypothetical protein
MSNTTIPPPLEEQIQKEYPTDYMSIWEQSGCNPDTLQLCREESYLNEKLQSSARYGVSIALEQQWISVKDRLPDEDGDYIVYITSPTDNEVRVLWFFQQSNETIVWLNGISFAYEVTHWMPLPPKPKE